MENSNDGIVRRVLTWLIVLGVFHICSGQDKKFTYSDIYGKERSGIMGKVPAIIGWLDERSYLIWEPSENNRKEILQKIDAQTGEANTLVDFSTVNERFQTGRFSAPWSAHTNDYTGFIISFENDLYYFSSESGSILQLTDIKAKENNPTFSPDGRHIAFTRNHDLFTVDVGTGIEKRLTSDGTDLIYNGYASWIYYEEILGRRSRYKAFWWAPDSKMIAFLRFDDSPVPEFPIFHCEGIHGYLEIQRYPKPGDTNPSVKLGVAHLNDKKISWIDSNGKADKYLAWPSWTVDSKKLLFQNVNRGQDKIQIYKSDPLSGSKKMIYEERQPSWINFFEDLYLLENEMGFLLRSDKSGWRHLYLYDLEGKLIHRLTEGNWDVSKIVKVDENKREVFFQGFVDNSEETHLFVVNLDGSDLKKVTMIPGTHSTKVAPSGNYFIDTFSNIHQPKKVVLSNRSGDTIRLLGDNNSPNLESYNLGQTEIFTLPTEDGVELPALWVLPPNFDKSKKYPVIFQVYGGPGRANVKNQYRSLANHYLAQNDIIVFTVDHRGSYHFGKEGQSLMHRNLGKWEMNDYIEAVKWLHAQPFVDKNRIGIIGSSYGGYVVAMALTYGAEYFTHGVALYSVTDWRLYDNFYTERFMDTPDENPEGYTFGSASTHADNYKGKMLIVHGALDDNVHMQNTAQLIQILQKLDKSFELMIYPNQKHGARGAWRKHGNRETVNFWFRHFFGREIVVEQ
jgi:dipeptidyl-peptidase-4